MQQVLADNPAIEVASDVPSFKFTQWDGKLLREIPRLRFKPGARLEPATGYADMAIESCRLFDRLQQGGVILIGVKFQISLPTPIAPTDNNMMPTDRPALIPVLTTHMLGEVAAIVQAYFAGKVSEFGNVGLTSVRLEVRRHHPTDTEVIRLLCPCLPDPRQAPALQQ
jgi:hypothetical protein